MNICETSFGITEYISDLKGFFGIIKQRFSDFQVNEISSSGQVIHLTSEVPISIPTHKVSIKDIKQPPEVEDEQVELLKIISGQKSINDTEKSVVLVRTENSVDYKVEDAANKRKELKIKVTEISKEKRTIIHRYIKAQFPNLNSTTKDIDNEKFICITRQEFTLKRDKRSGWPKSENQVNFVLYKENIDTMEAINTLAGKLGLRPGMFCYAGTKDRRGKTSQLVSVYQVAPQNIFSAAKALNRVRVGNFFFSNKPQRLGQAKGNHFKIVLREVDGSEENITEGVSSLKERGFINYFGMQRFSSSQVSTHTIGRAILKGDWQQAVDLILFPRENDLPDLAEAKQIWKEKKDGVMASKCLMPKRRHTIEGQLLAGLACCGSNNFVNALERIPRNTKLMYIHAYQSYLWNNVVSKRIKKYKLKVLPGDTVRNRMKKNEDDEDETEDQNASDRVRILTPEEASTVDITEVLMPLPGYNTIYPDNEIKDWYMEYLMKDDLSVDVFQNKVKTFSLGGAYRSVLVMPYSVTWCSCHYEDPTKPLIQSDLDVLQNIAVEQNRLTDGPYKALILEFSLPTASYATMALRELIKMETSSKFQSTLNSKRKIEDDDGSKEEASEKKIKLDDE